MNVYQERLVVHYLDIHDLAISDLAVQAAFDRYTTAEIAQAELDPVPQEEQS